MSKVLIDRAVLEATLEHAEFVSGAACAADDAIRAVLVAPSGTPELPVKAYYHESPNEHGGLNKSVGLEQRKTFSDAPLVLESDALVQIACLEGEIAKRGLRIVELESRYQRDVFGLNNEGDPIGGDPAGGYANDTARLRSELAAIKAQEPVAHDTKGSRKALGAMNAKLKAKIGRLERELAAPAAKPQVVIPELDREGFEDEYSGEYGTPVSVLRLLRDGENYIEKPQHSDRLNSSWWMWKRALARLNATPVQQVSAPDGWKLVPVEPTPEMISAGIQTGLIAKAQQEGPCHWQWTYPGGFYRAMLAAAPAAPPADAGHVFYGMDGNHP